jgi:hypothetical protein
VQQRIRNYAVGRDDHVVTGLAVHALWVAYSRWIAVTRVASALGLVHTGPDPRGTGFRAAKGTAMAEDIGAGACGSIPSGRRGIMRGQHSKHDRGWLPTRIGMLDSVGDSRNHVALRARHRTSETGAPHMRQMGANPDALGAGRAVDCRWRHGIAVLTVASGTVAARLPASVAGSIDAGGGARVLAARTQENEDWKKTYAHGSGHADQPATARRQRNHRV